MNEAVQDYSTDNDASPPITTYPSSFDGILQWDGNSKYGASYALGLDGRLYIESPSGEMFSWSFDSSNLVSLGAKYSSPYQRGERLGSAYQNEKLFIIGGTDQPTKVELFNTNSYKRTELKDFTESLGGNKGIPGGACVAFVPGKMTIEYMSCSF